MNVLLNVQGIVIHNNHICLTSKGQGYVIYTKIKKPLIIVPTATRTKAGY